MDWHPFKTQTDPKLTGLRKDIIAIFQNEGLKITIDTNLTTTDFFRCYFGPKYRKVLPVQKTLMIDRFMLMPIPITHQLFCNSYPK